MDRMSSTRKTEPTAKQTAASSKSARARDLPHPTPHPTPHPSTTSVYHIAGGIPANAVTLGLVAGQGAMAAMSFAGFAKAA